MDLGEAYRGKRVLLTGHTGFKGAWLALWLRRLGAEVGAVALPPDTEPNLWSALGLENEVHSEYADIRDSGRLRALVDAFRPEFVFHLAAQALVLPSYEDPVGTFATNLMGTVNLLEACRHQPSIRAMVVVTSDKCYRQPGRHPFREDDPLGGEDPYSASKACAELATAAYRHAYFREGVGLATVRAGNVIGGGDWAAHRLVPDLMRAFQQGRTPGIRRPEARRPWQHVLDPLDGYLRLGAKLAADPGPWSGPWNVGPTPEQAWTVAQVADACCRAWGGTANWILEGAPSGLEAERLELDGSRIRECLGWTPRWTVEAAIERSVRWYRAFADGVPARVLCETDLEARG